MVYGLFDIRYQPAFYSIIKKTPQCKKLVLFSSQPIVITHIELISNPTSVNLHFYSDRMLGRYLHFLSRSVPNLQNLTWTLIQIPPDDVEWACNATGLIKIPFKQLQTLSIHVSSQFASENENSDTPTMTTVTTTIPVRKIMKTLPTTPKLERISFRRDDGQVIEEDIEAFETFVARCGPRVPNLKRSENDGSWLIIDW